MYFTRHLLRAHIPMTTDDSRDARCIKYRDLDQTLQNGTLIASYHMWEKEQTPYLRCNGQRV